MRRGNGGRLGFENGRTRLNSLSFFFVPCRRDEFFSSMAREWIPREGKPPQRSTKPRSPRQRISDGAYFGRA